MPSNLQSVDQNRIANAIELSVLVSGMQSELPDRDVVWVRMFVNNRGATTSLKAVHWTLKNLWLEDVAEVVSVLSMENAEKQIQSARGRWYYQPVVFTLFMDNPIDRKVKNRSSIRMISPPKSVKVIVGPTPIHLEETDFSGNLTGNVIGATVSLFAKIGPDGKVMDALIFRSSGVESIDKAALAPAPNNRFTPLFVNGRPEIEWVTYQVTFDNLNKSRRSTTVFESSIGNSSDSDAFVSMDEFVPVEVMPEMIAETTPKYPNAAKREGKSGRVWIKVLVGKDGRVKEAAVAKSSGHSLLDNAALKVATKNLFRPGLQDGKPVAVWINYKVDFLLR